MKRFQWQKVVAVVGALLAVSLIGCACPFAKHHGPMTLQEMEAKAAKHVTSITVEQAKADVDAGKYGAIIDVREAGEYKIGHIPNALNIPRGVLEYKIEGQVPDKNTSILVYCKVGGRGTFSAEALAMLGYTKVVNLAGGWQAWEAAGYPVE